MSQQKQILELKSELKHGDMLEIARLTGFSYHHVVNAFGGRRRVHPLMVDAARMIIDARRRRMADMMSTNSK